MKTHKAPNLELQIANMRVILNARDQLSEKEKAEIVKLKFVIQRLEAGIPRESLIAFLSAFSKVPCKHTKKPDPPFAIRPVTEADVRAYLKKHKPQNAA